ncbi:MAG: M28 family peptidase, partial [Vicinamibacteria bacterium]|nr:M28 family peptidase [Vicinamibacteria bacterium]
QSWDAQFRALPEAARIGEYMRRLSARPHHLGSPYDKDNAEWIAGLLTQWGWQVEIEQFHVLMPTPKSRRLEMTAPTRFVASLVEPPVAVDPTSGQQAEQLPSYNAYSADGDVTGRLVYVNYGRQQDYEVLDRLGVSVKGAIVIARYGGSWRGIKPKLAAQHGAIGCLIYSDPKDDGYFDGEVYPAGPMRNKDGVQRGSVMDMPVHPGDPLTPSVGATRDVQRLAVKDAPTIMKIPVLPISYADAQPLLSAITGRLAPEDWRGALPIPYRIGPGEATVHLSLAFNWTVTPLYNVIARLPGTTFADEWILRGNHHDAWVNGAEDPVSGMAAELEEARALGELRRRGWAPKRTIVYLAWDGEEQGLLGSTEHVEARAGQLQRHAVVYLNTDSNSRGFLGISGSHALEGFINDVARDVSDPESGVSVWKRAQARRIVRGTPIERQEARSRANLRISALGSGSDYTPFLQHAGIASLDLGFGGEDQAGIYHSVYDSFHHYTQFQDRDFVYGRALAQTVGTAVIRLADADRLPFDFTSLADTLSTYLKELQELVKTMQEESRERARQLDEGAHLAVDDPRRPLLAPPRLPLPPALNFAPLENALTTLAASATRFQNAGRAGPAASVDVLRRVNAKLREAERQLTDPAGLAGRPWYRHLVYAPGLYTGYGVKTLPGVREAIEQKQFPAVEAEVVRAARAVERLAALLDQASAELTPAGRQ